MSDRPNTTEPAGGDTRIGVVIPVHNRRTILLETLPHVLSQTRSPERLVIVDDGSTDGTADAVEHWLTHERPCFDWRVVRAPKRTAAAARQAGLELVADLPLVAFLDSDDHWPADFLERSAAVMRADGRAVATSADRHYVYADGSPPEDNDCRELAGDPLVWFFRHGEGVASCSLFRTSAVFAAGGWEPERVNAEDSVLFCRVALEGPWRHTPGAPVRFHIGSAEHRREHPNLSNPDPETLLGCAEAHEAIYHEVIRRDPGIDRRPLLAELSRYWKNAGKGQWSLGNLAEAEACFRRSFETRPQALKPLGRLAITKVYRRLAA